MKIIINYVSDMSDNHPSLNRVLEKLKGEETFIYVRKAKELERKGYRIINFGIGQPDIPTFQNIVDEAKNALDARFTGYTEVEGMYKLRETIAKYLNDKYNTDIEAEEVIVTPGAKGAIFLALVAYLNPGDEVIIPEPTFPSYPEVTNFLNAIPRFIPLRWLGSEKGFKLDLEGIYNNVTNKTKVIIVNSPHNPTGAVFSKDQIKKLYEIAVEKNILIITDEIYDYFIYDGDFYSFLNFPEWRENILYVNGFSKTFSMTGWRLGYLVAKKEIIEKLSNVAVNIWSCPVSFVQKAAIAALRGDMTPVTKMVEIFRRRREIMVKKLREIKGFEVWSSKGAFYVYPRIKNILGKTGLSTGEFVDELLYSKKVVVLPGTVFPDKAGEGFLRFSFAVDEEDIRLGIDKIKEFVEEIGI